MKVLLIYPQYPDTFWSFKYALKFVFKKAISPPLGLLTVASLLPPGWEKKLVDMNVERLKEEDMKRADFVFLSAMAVQKDSVKEVIARCKKIGTPIVAGGPLFTSQYEEFADIDHFVLDEAEVTLPKFLKDLKNGSLKHIYASKQRANIERTPIPSWDLIDLKKYASMSIQYSRGCPFDCEFCDVTVLYGHRPRTKTKDQIIAELDALYERGWREGVLFVDDNFIANKVKLKREILPAIIEWMERRKYPFSFITQTSIDLSEDEELLRLMVRAGFNTVFIGIETPNEKSLSECGKLHNKGLDLIECIRKIQRFGIQVQGGFILGFDSDPLSIFERQIKLIQQSGIVTAMVGLLNALKGTRLYRRLKKEKRLIKDSSGNNMDCSINFIPKMGYDILIEGYKRVLSTIYSPTYYYERIKKFLIEYNTLGKERFRFRLFHLLTLLKTMLHIGIIRKERFHYWRLLFWSLGKCPHLFPLAIRFSIYGVHFQKIIEKYMG
jgi:radical SAM superfamily enzyme YgiQ (UPF0313 family)